MGILSDIKTWLAPAAPLDADTQQAIAQAVKTVDPRLVTVGGYERRLAPAVRHALAYCDGLVESIPGPIDINVQSFAADPLVHAFFAAPGDIARMLGASREVRNFIADPANLAAAEFFAMIGMRRKEKTVLGLEMHGEVIQEGAPQRLLYFADHTLHEMSTDPAVTRLRLRAAAFESLAKSFVGHLEDLRARRQDLRNAWDQERARARSASAHDADAVAAQRRQELEQSLRAAAESLEPGHVLEAFAAWLAAPESRLHLEETSVAVDRLGVMADPARDGAAVQTLTLPELIGRDRRRWIVLLTRISREDALRAQQESAQATRYLII
ncbi:MAG: hypothetical protein A2045_02740 [Rhodocyclales bacterium GWA2_65_20]|nr:MAG: hypothetical protein A2045_02740 [Rhodocyclales bacterium GWA2_65_20]